MTVQERTDREVATCEQGEWDAVEAARPGSHDFTQGSIASETDAEVLAHGAPTIQAGVEAQNSCVITTRLHGDTE